MGDNEPESDYEYEEAVVLVELNGIIDANFLLQEQKPTKILGIERDQPILQIGHYIFSGEYDDTLGTVVGYEPVKTVNSDGKEEENYKFVCKTDKKLSMKRVFVQEKENTKTDESEQTSSKTSANMEQSNSPNTTDDSAMDCSDSTNANSNISL